MKTHTLSAPPRLGRRFLGLVASVCLLASGSGLWAQGSVYASVNYNPTATTHQINTSQLPYTNAYPLTITSPVSAAGLNYSGGGITVPLKKYVPIPGSLPPGVTEVAALNYVTLSGSDLTPVPGGDPTLTFTGPNQTKTVTVTVSFPLGIVPGSYVYKLVTVGWPAGSGFNPLPGGASNLGSDINGSVSANNTPSSPIVEITTPADGSSYNILTSQLPYAVPLKFKADVPGLTPTNITGVSADLSTSASGGGTSVTLTTVTGLNTAHVVGAGSLVVNGPGTYYVSVYAVNAGKPGSFIRQHTFTVVVSGPPPTISITSPVAEADFPLYAPAQNVTVPTSFTATTPAGSTLQTWAATLTYPDGTSAVQSISPSSVPSGLTSTGSVTLSLTVPGHYTLGATVSNQYSSASDTKSFWVNRITSPTDQTVDAFTNATFTTTAEGRANLTYQWQRQFNGAGAFYSLSNDATYAGVATPTLTVNAAKVPMTGDRFQCVVSIPGFPLRDMVTSSALLTVRKLTPVLTWPAPTAIIYGTALSGTQLNATASVGGTLVYTPASGANPGVGSAPLRVDFTPADSANYNPAFATVTQVVTKAPLIVTASSASKVYGAPVPTVFTASYSAFVLGEGPSVLGGALTFTTNASTSSGVGSGYTITPGGLTSANYAITFVPGILTVTRAPLTIKADDKTKVTGAALPALTASYSGLVGADTAAVVTGLALTTTATASSPVGSYPITAANGTAANYAITYQPGTLTVTAAGTLALTITQPDGSVIVRVAGSAPTVVPFAFTAVATGGATVTTLAAKLGNASLAVTPAGLGTTTATGTGTLTVSAAGTYTFTVTATATGGLMTTRSVTFVVKETQPAPQPCNRLHWLPPISLDQVQKGGSTLPIRFHLHLCCQGVGTGYCDDHDDDHYGNDDDDHKGGDKDDDRYGDDDRGKSSGKDDDKDDKYSSSKSNSGSSSSSSGKHVCDEDDKRNDDRHDGWKDNGNGHCPLVKDTSVIISIYEVGKNSPAARYTYSANGKPKDTTYAIDGDKEYHLDFKTAKGTHRYHVDVDYFPTGSTVPVLLDAKEFSTR